MLILMVIVNKLLFYECFSLLIPKIYTKFSDTIFVHYIFVEELLFFYYFKHDYMVNRTNRITLNRIRRNAQWL